MEKGAPLPTDEAIRLAKVADLCPFESNSDEVFDKIVSMTAEFFDAPISLITIVERHRQWFRARVGIDVNETPRETSFCAYSILTKQPLEVLDARLDDRFKDNPLVTGPPFIRYYAGAPLVTDDGLSLGSLCIIDTKPRPGMNTREKSMLVYFAELVMMRITGVRVRNFVDQPTGLFNRLRLEEDIREVLHNGETAQLVAIDVLTPKFLNDMVKALGYNFAQDLVLAIKSRLLKFLPERCHLYKVSPTRFGFISPGLRPLAQLCGPIVEDFKEPIECDGIPILMQVGVGVLALENRNQLTQDWLRLVVSSADNARDRKTGWAGYESKFDEAHQRAFMLLSYLSNALKCPNQLWLMYQPQVNLKTGQCTCVEALLRWTHPVLGLVNPAEFIPLVQKTALMQPLSEWVLHEVIRQAKAWQLEGKAVRIAMNITVSDLESPAFVDRAESLLAAFGLQSNKIEIEFTESELITNAAEVSLQLQRLRALGMEISIDDFGTGYSNWTYLRQIPATTVKLDQSLTSRLNEDEKNQRLVRTLIELADRLDYRIVAEGIETEEVLRLVKDWGCTEGQGYLFAKPMSAVCFVDWLDSRVLRDDPRAKLTHSG
ncbi:sensor domain-containing phosphodiesterase [Pseudomonas sp. GM30]|uniref:sensor domain-containing phosphodiesterase n=1 Tax=Pseudomonas sp. GM30 TaxID=1144328 RepID=UPI0002701C03|nr:sensor domain-containing phosphodiesterase [Pseudomonas sp. GM30]EUB87715.1 diguanylate cyclase/phosphodiesterase with GAF sensor [Pseudomonas sp. GM30]